MGNHDNPDSAALSAESQAWPILMDKLVTVLADYAAQQVAAGADVIQVFDSWVGALSPTDYRQYVLAPTTDLIARIRALGVSVIYFGVDTASLLPAMRETGADVLGLDWRTPLDEQRTTYNVQPSAWPILMSKLVTVLADFAAQQVAAGADVIQVFDSWVGALSPTDYRQYVLAPTTDLIARIRALGVPVIYFGVDTASLLPAMRDTGADVIGLDWRTPLDQAWSALGHAVAVQGNLDPIALFAPPDVLHSRVAEVLAAAAGRPGHIFNLGHGIVPTTPVDAVLAVVHQIKSTTPSPPLPFLGATQSA